MHSLHEKEILTSREVSRIRDVAQENAVVGKPLVPINKGSHLGELARA